MFYLTSFNQFLDSDRIGYRPVYIFQITNEDNFPKTICNKCVKTLNWIHKFATMAVQTQNKFTKLLSNIVVSESNQNEEDHHHSLLHTYLTQVLINSLSN